MAADWAYGVYGPGLGLSVSGLSQPPLYSVRRGSLTRAAVGAARRRFAALTQGLFSGTDLGCRRHTHTHLRTRDLDTHTNDSDTILTTEDRTRRFGAIVGLTGTGMRYWRAGSCVARLGRLRLSATWHVALIAKPAPAQASVSLQTSTESSPPASSLVSPQTSSHGTGIANTSGSPPESGSGRPASSYATVAAVTVTLLGS